MRLAFRAFVLFACLALPTVTGCAAISLLPDVIAAVTDGTQLLDAIDIFINAYFVSHPNPTEQAKCAAAMAKCRAALNTALRAAQAATALDQGQVDAAFADFKDAYASLLVLVQPYGVVPTHAGNFAASPGTLQVPEPIALHLKPHR